MNRALQWKLIAGFVLVFIAGGITGALVGGAHVRHAFFRGPPRGFFKERMEHRMRGELQLTPEQMAKISPIIDRAGNDIDNIRTETARRVHDTMRRAHEEMSGLLTDEQRAKLKEIEARHRRQMRRFHEPPPSPEASPEQ